MKKNYLKIITIIGILLICVVAMNILAMNIILVKDKAISPKAVNGVLDLRNYEFNGAEPVEMNGEWEFVPNKLLDSPALDEQKNYLVQVPSLWTDYDLLFNL
ncbi:hypothetical protein [Psychrobacillus soli]|uniref:hypothetical protein n=1 Tax=Psychrobacillus soli TaxID=1543965 RepID=UPI001FEB58AD|nr:hypothetical protein [Psychrobacillus soli]